MNNSTVITYIYTVRLTALRENNLQSIEVAFGVNNKQIVLGSFTGFYDVLISDELLLCPKERKKKKKGKACVESVITGQKGLGKKQKSNFSNNVV